MLRRRTQLVAVLAPDGVAAPAGRPRYASYGAGVAVPGIAPVGVEVVTEAAAGSRPQKRIVALTRFVPGTRIPGRYRVVAELAAEE